MKTVNKLGDRMKSSQSGFIGILITLLLVFGFIFALFFVRIKASNEIVSGIVYNTTNDRFISGATCFSVRAGENTPVTMENESSYCIPKNSEYKALINKAAADKRIKVTVEASKYFTVKAPWSVVPNVKVTEIK